MVVITFLIYLLTDYRICLLLKGMTPLFPRLGPFPKTLFSSLEHLCENRGNLSSISGS